MEPRATENRDPVIAAILATVVPGSGLIYAGETRAGGVLLIGEALLFALGWWLVLLPLHAWQVAMSAGTASVRGERRRDVFETRRALNPGPGE